MVDDVRRVYLGSDADATRALYADLAARGPAGLLAAHLLRAQKNSSRAKVYRGGLRGQGSYRRLAYDRKQWALEQVTLTLVGHAEALGLPWGWQTDPAAAVHREVLYVDLPTGQVSFHTDRRGVGPTYAGTWDGLRDVAADRIIRWAASVLAAPTTEPTP